VRPPAPSRASDLRHGRVGLRYAGGGHPAPLLASADGTVAPLAVRGALLGAFPDVHLEEAPAILEPGDAIVLYTDGVTEARRGLEMLGEDGLAAVVRANLGADARAIALAVERAVLEQAGGALRDDVAVVVGRALPPGIA
jgi:serine phosphatase RsbU (regulator of sigma subunit)